MVLNAAYQLPCFHAGENGQCHLGPHAIGLDERAEPLAFVAITKAEQQLSILAYHQMGVEHHLGPGFGQTIEGGHGRFQLIAHAGRFQQQPGRPFFQQGAAQPSDHRNLPLRTPLRAVPVPAWRARPTRMCAWQMATPSASAASDGGVSSRLSNRVTIWAT